MPPPVEKAPVNDRSGDRIAKLLARAGVASRREVERMIAEGRVARDGVPIDTAATVLPSLHGVTVDGEPVASAAPARLFLYHKPPGLLVTERDPRGRPTIYDRLPQDLPRVVPVGRLDLATEGLLLLTTDGGLKRQLELPATGVERAYRARAYGQVTQGQLEALIEGVEIEGVRYGPIDANLERRTGANVWIELILTEGKNREVRRVLEYLGLQVGRLIRTRYGPFILADLPPGEIGEVRQADLAAFRQTLGKKQPHEQSIAVTAATRPAAARSGPARRSDAKPLPRAGGSPGPASTAARNAPDSRASATTPARSRRSNPKLHPDAGRGPVPTTSEERSTPATSAPSQGQRSRPSRAPAPARAGVERRPPPSGSARPDPALRRGGAQAKAGAHKPDRVASDGPAKADAPPARPAKIERKTGWARPKPKSGPKRPRKP